MVGVSLEYSWSIVGVRRVLQRAGRGKRRDIQRVCHVTIVGCLNIRQIGHFSKGDLHISLDVISILV